MRPILVLSALVGVAAACGSNGGSGSGGGGGADASAGTDAATDAGDDGAGIADAAEDSDAVIYYHYDAPYGDDAPDSVPVDAAACPIIGMSGLTFGSSFCDQCMVDSCCDVVTACFGGGDGGGATECAALASCVARCDADAGADGALDACLGACTAAHVDDAGQPDPAVVAYDAVQDCMSLQCGSARCD